MSLLHQFVAPLGVKEFKERHFTKVPFAAARNAVSLRKVISWPDVIDILEKEHPDCWLAKQGKMPPLPTLCRGTLQPKHALEYYQKGYTLVIRHAEASNEGLKSIAHEFAQFFERPVDIQVYITPAGEQGFDWHYDLEEVFIIQTSGEKDFQLKENTTTKRPLPRPLPKDLQFELETHSGELRCLLRAGDCLYVPAGYWHRARAITPSIHISIGVMM